MVSADENRMNIRLFDGSESTPDLWLLLRTDTLTGLAELSDRPSVGTREPGHFGFPRFILRQSRPMPGSWRRCPVR